MNRRDFIRASTAGLAAATIPAADSGRAADNVSEGQLGSLRSATPSDLQGLVGDGRQRRILLRGGVVLSPLIFLHCGQSIALASAVALNLCYLIFACSHKALTNEMDWQRSH